VFFANFGWVQVASLYQVDEKNELVGAPVAAVGEDVLVEPDDEMVRMALQAKTLVSVRPDSTMARTSKLLAAIPIVDVHERSWGLLVIRNMLFIAFHDENLQLLSILGGHIGDLLTAGPGLSSSRNLSIQEFLGHVRRSVLDRRRFELPVAIIALVPPEPETSQALTDLVIGQRRGLDQVLQVEDRAQKNALLLLMPLTEERGVEGYLSRLSENLKRKVGRSLAESKIEVHVRLLDETDEAEAVVDHMRTLCGIHETEIARHISA